MTQTQDLMTVKLIIETMIYSLEEVKGKSNCSNIIITVYFDIWWFLEYEVITNNKSSLIRSKYYGM